MKSYISYNIVNISIHMWQATRKAAELIKLVTYCNNVNACCANLSCTPITHAHKNRKNPQNIAESYKKLRKTDIVIIIYYSNVCQKSTIS